MGSRWGYEIAKELEHAHFGLICLTRDNIDAPWIMFEAGALSKNLDMSKVCPILFGVDAGDLKGPLAQFQACKFERIEIYKVVKMINGEMGLRKLSDAILSSSFDTWWPKLEEGVKHIFKSHSVKSVRPQRSERDLLEEMVGLRSGWDFLRRHSTCWTSR